jgi:integrase
MSARRRANGEGTVYRRASDGLFAAAVVLPDATRKVMYGKTEREVLAKRRTALRDLEDGLPVHRRQPGTLGEWVAREWFGATLPARVAAGTLSPETLDSYRDNWRLHVEPVLGHVRLDKLTPALVRSWQTQLLTKTSARGKPLSARTVAYCHAILRKALNDALRDEVPGVRRNVVTLVEAPRVARGGRGRALELPEVAAVVRAIDEDPHRVLWLTYLGLGLRRGEALALRWSAIDFDTGTARIAASLKRRRTDEVTASGHRRGRLVEDRPKTDASATTVAVPAPVIELWREHLATQRRARMAAPIWADPDLVFSTSIGTAIEPRNINRAWTEVCTRAGIPPVRVHDLRHTMASLMLRQGADVKVVQRALRHTRHATTADIYMTVLEDVQRAGADQMGALLTELGVGR